MEKIYRMRALRLLTEDAHLNAPTRELLEALIGATPVVMRGYATMVPMSELIRTLKTNALEPFWQSGTECDVLNALDEVDWAYWSTPFLEGNPIGTFLSGHALSRHSGLLHFQLDHALLAAIAQISQRLKANSGEPPEMKH